MEKQVQENLDLGEKRTPQPKLLFLPLKWIGNLFYWRILSLSF